MFFNSLRAVLYSFDGMWSESLIALLTFSVQRLKWQFSAAAGTLFSLNVHFGTVFFSFRSGKTYVHVMGHSCPVCLSTVK